MKKARTKSKKKYNLVYQTNLVGTNKFYIGKHSTDKTEDGYIGSGRWVTSIRDKSKLDCSCVCIMRSERSAFDFEEYLVDQVKKNPDSGCMNFIKGGIGGFTHSEEEKRKIGLAQVGRRHTEETRKKMSSWQIGRIRPESTKEKIRQKLTGVDVVDKVTRKAISYKIRKWIVCMKTGMVFHGAKECAAFWGISENVVRYICGGKTKSSKFDFEYMDK